MTIILAFLLYIHSLIMSQAIWIINHKNYSHPFSPFHSTYTRDTKFIIHLELLQLPHNFPIKENSWCKCYFSSTFQSTFPCWCLVQNSSIYVYSLNFFIHVRNFFMVVYSPRHFFALDVSFKIYMECYLDSVHHELALGYTVLVLIKQSWQYSL